MGIFYAVGVIVLLALVLVGALWYMTSPKRGPVTPEEKLIESHNRR